MQKENIFRKFLEKPRNMLAVALCATLLALATAPEVQPQQLEESPASVPTNPDAGVMSQVEEMVSALMKQSEQQERNFTPITRDPRSLQEKMGLGQDASCKVQPTPAK